MHLLLYNVKTQQLILPLRLFPVHCHFLLNCKPQGLSHSSFLYPSYLSFVQSCQLQLLVTYKPLPLPHNPYCGRLWCVHLRFHTSLSLYFTLTTLTVIVFCLERGKGMSTAVQCLCKAAADN